MRDWPVLIQRIRNVASDQLAALAKLLPLPYIHAKSSFNSAVPFFIRLRIPVYPLFLLGPQIQQLHPQNLIHDLQASCHVWRDRR